MVSRAICSLFGPLQRSAHGIVSKVWMKYCVKPWAACGAMIERLLGRPCAD